MGSLVPLSRSRVGSILFFSFFPPCDRKIANTAAASVEETMEPISRDSMREKPVIQLMNSPTPTVVIRTPAVERAIPLQSMDFTSPHLVSSPPEKRMKTRAMIPMNCVILGSLKYIPPIPSEPASIPIKRKKINEGNSQSVGGLT